MKTVLIYSCMFDLTEKTNKKLFIKSVQMPLMAFLSRMG